MDIARLFRACKIGDIVTLKQLVEQKDVDLNVKDLWDSSPLYYACLCGHDELVNYLLENGAKCDSNTFDGERCVYGSLTKDIRKLLVKDYAVITKKLIQRNDFDEMLRMALSMGEFVDIEFHVHGTIFRAHRCVLSVRCEYFADMFRTKWAGRRKVSINHHLVSADAFEVLLQFLYTGNLDFPVAQLSDVKALLKQCKMMEVMKKLDEHHQAMSMFVQSKSKRKVANISMQLSVAEDFYQLYRTCALQRYDQEPKSVDPNETNFADVIFKVDDRYFYCHKFFFSGRSDFFRAIVRNYFSEGNDGDDNNAPVFEMRDISIDSFQCLCRFMYTNTADISLEMSFELIVKSDLYLLGSLKKLCSNIIRAHITEVNVLDVINLARILGLPKLESAAIEHIAHNLDEYITSDEFRALVIADAQNIKERQETDTIDIIDDIHFFLSNFYHKDQGHKLDVINRFLEQLGYRAYPKFNAST